MKQKKDITEAQEHVTENKSYTHEDCFKKKKEEALCQCEREPTKVFTPSPLPAFLTQLVYFSPVEKAATQAVLQMSAQQCCCSFTLGKDTDLF